MESAGLLKRGQAKRTRQDPIQPAKEASLESEWDFPDRSEAKVLSQLRGVPYDQQRTLSIADNYQANHRSREALAAYFHVLQHEPAQTVLR